MTTRSLVIGGTGFLGLAIVDALREAGHDVALTRRRSSNTILARRRRVPMLSAELGDVPALTAAMAGRDTVFMVAGHYPRFSVDTESQVAQAVAGLRSVVDAARLAGVRRLVYTSSSATWLEPLADSTYFAVKLALEAEARRAADAGGLDVITLCPTACLGPGDYKVGTGFFVLGMLTGALQVWVDGYIDVVDVADVAAAHVAAATRGTPGARYLIGGHGLAIRALLETIAGRWQVSMPDRELSHAEAHALATAEETRCVAAGGRERPLLSREMVDLAITGAPLDPEPARAALGLTVRPLTETIDRACRWYRDNGFAPTPSPVTTTGPSPGGSP